MMKEKLSFGLMLISIFGLTVFLGLWLRKSFLEEQENLKTALAFEVIKASSELKDSLIFNYQTDDSLKQIKTDQNSDQTQNWLLSSRYSRWDD
ncbi:MAG TPA: hypothetical protein PLZ32_06270 [Saprospiraceae bacterium]|nr:hypothetical protein [Saprospiraceae bacterium]